ncbi:hypothetical protein KFE25_011313 [Diacronema lutheri]|uniref:NAD(P)-binding domain-containing protein n=2 Tax=Diacronema lutheri TaxID=2081491 RepID=A0A8J5X5Y6_DIALT|nr:hypothetical protein KFE25_011313 [Diacronema lutheri]
MARAFHLLQLALVALGASRASGLLAHRALPAVGRAPAAAALRARARARSRAAPACTLVVFGATGGVGSEVAFQALERGESVVALCRDPSKLSVPAGSGGPAAGARLANPKLTAVKGDVTSRADVAAAFDAARDEGVSGVVVALGGRTSDVGPTMLRDGTAAIISEMKARGLKRVAVVTSIGAGDSEGQAPFMFKVLMMTVMKSIFADKNAQEALFNGGADAPGASLEFTLVRPGGLTLDPPNGIINVIDGQAGSISRADVAAFCLDAVSASDWPHLRKAPCISSVKGTSWAKDKGAPVGGNVRN